MIKIHYTYDININKSVLHSIVEEFGNSISGGYKPLAMYDGEKFVVINNNHYKKMKILKAKLKEIIFKDNHFYPSDLLERVKHPFYTMI